jgi:acetyl-CoA carboxylase alpha subunit
VTASRLGQCRPLGPAVVCVVVGEGHAGSALVVGRAADQEQDGVVNFDL